MASGDTRAGGQRGQATLEWAGLAVLVAALLAGLTLIGLPARIGDGVSSAVATILGGHGSPATPGAGGGGSASGGGGSAFGGGSGLGGGVTALGGGGGTSGSVDPGGVSGTPDCATEICPDGPIADWMFAQKQAYYIQAQHYCEGHPNQRMHPNPDVKGAPWIACGPYLKALSSGSFSWKGCIEGLIGIPITSSLYATVDQMIKAGDDVKAVTTILKDVKPSFLKTLGPFGLTVACAIGGTGGT